MFLRHKVRRKDGKEHRYWSIVENRRVSGGRTVQRHVLYLGEINDSQRAAWCQTIEAFDEDGQQARQIALFPEHRQAPALNCNVVHVRLSGLRLHRPRQWGACWLACRVWDQLRLDDFWSPRLPVSREGTRWLDVLKTLVAYRLIEPGSEWRLHRQWYDQSAMGDLLGADFALAHKDTLYRCLDRLLMHKAALFSFLHLKEAKGIGTPATRAEIIKGLKRQNLLTADGKFVVPTSGGLQIFELLRQAAPGLVDPATTASWEMRLDDIVAGRGDFRSVIDGIAETASRLIEILQGQSYRTIDLGVAQRATGRAKSRTARKLRAVSEQTANTGSGKQRARRRRLSKPIKPPASTFDLPSADKDAFRSGGGTPTARMVSYAKLLAGNKNVQLPPRLEQDFEICRRFLDQHSR